MKKQLVFIFTIFISSIIFSQSFYDLSIKSIEGDTINFDQFKGQYVLVVNVASRCGYTKQYADLETLYQTYDNLVVIGVPSNQFANQEPRSEAEILKFCTDKYNVSFPMTSKINVKGQYKHQLYAWLTEKNNNLVDDFKISWNFNKFLINPSGKLIGHFTSKVKPLNSKITSLIK
ncbi:MAG: glutathione peroxidase [Flavobacteriales bacterium]|nr:glutathione peroxidase [Flavobacteriales bacterium]|tara:strand:+ start:1328 stop:1852 length:525 start_codon:yes stop_codon:yes gene_type:complete